MSAAPTQPSRASKDKRNARDRRLIERKKQTVQQMHERVTRLEGQKHALQLQLQLGDVGLSHAPPHERYLRSLQHAERLRLENQALADRISQRELLANALEACVDDHAALEMASPIASAFSPAVVTERQAWRLGERLCADVGSVQRRVDAMQRFSQFRVFGWSDLRCRTTERLDFAVEKPFVGHTAAALADQTWRIFTNARTCKQVCPTLLAAEPKFQYFGDCLAISRGDFSGPALDGLGNAFVYVRAHNERDGSRYMLAGTFDTRSLEEDLAAQKPFPCPMYWLFQDAPRESGEPCTLVQFGGSMPSADDGACGGMIAELIFNVVRWETMGVRPLHLTWEEAQDDTSSEASASTSTSSSLRSLRSLNQFWTA